MEVPLKLMIDKEKNKVVFAEAGKDFVDVLFSFLTLPLGTIVRLLGKEDSDSNKEVKFGSLSSLYESVSNLDKDYLSSDTCKDMLLQPRNSMEEYCKNMKLNIDDTKPTTYYVCSNLLSCRRLTKIDASTFENKRCRCGNLLSTIISPKNPIIFNGFVKSNVAFLIDDCLRIVPNSLESMFSLLKNYGIDNNMPTLEELNVNVTKKQVLDLLKNCLLSKTTLTDVFLEKKLELERFEQKRPLSASAAKYGSQINVKLVQRKSNREILFAQGREDFADFLFSFLTFPLGAVVHLLEGYFSIGSVDGLYHSIANLSEDYFISKEIKDKLVFPALAPQFKLSKEIIPIHQLDYFPTYYCCTTSYNHKWDNVLGDYYLTPTSKDYYGVDNLESCNVLDMVDPILEKGSGNKGFAKGPTMYFATDGLVVRPMSSISVISLLNSMNIPISDLEEKVVNIGTNEGLSILMASLTSTSALTNGLCRLLIKVKEEK